MIEWCKSRRSYQNGNCVEVARIPPAVLVRDSKDPDGGILEFAPAEWKSFLDGIKNEEFNSVPSR